MVALGCPSAEGQPLVHENESVDADVTVYPRLERSRYRPTPRFRSDFRAVRRYLGFIGILSKTPEHLLTDQNGRPYFLWDSDVTLDEFRAGLADPNPKVRGYLVGKLMRQAKPDDVFLFVTRREIRELWPYLERYLGQSRELWTWLFEQWDRLDHGDQ